MKRHFVLSAFGAFALILGIPMQAEGGGDKQSPNVIKEVQSSLKDQGYYDGKIDGKMNSDLKAGLVHFQEANDLPATGKVNHKTLSALDIEHGRQQAGKAGEKKSSGY